MDFERPLVSLGLPVFNGGRYLEGALESILTQSFRDFELIISDNASTDETQQICTAFAKKDKRIKYRRNSKNVGLAANHNLLFSASIGKYFKWVAHDDEYDASMLQRCVEILEAAPPTVALVYTKCEMIDEHGRSIGVASDQVASRSQYSAVRLSRFLKNANIYAFTYGLVRSEVLRMTSLYGLFPMSDRVLFAEISMLGELQEIDEPLLRLRLHPGRSLRLQRTSQARRELFDPSATVKGAFLSPRIRAYIEVVHRSLTTPPSTISKISCAFISVLIPPWQGFRNFFGYWRRKFLSIGRSQSHRGDAGEIARTDD